MGLFRVRIYYYGGRVALASVLGLVLAGPPVADRDWAVVGSLLACLAVGLLLAAAKRSPKDACFCTRELNTLTFYYLFGRSSISVDDVEGWYIIPPNIRLLPNRSRTASMVFRRGYLGIRVRGCKRGVVVPSADIDQSIVRLIRRSAPEVPSAVKSPLWRGLLAVSVWLIVCGYAIWLGFSHGYLGVGQGR